MIYAEDISYSYPLIFFQSIIHTMWEILKQLGLQTCTKDEYAVKLKSKSKWLSILSYA